MRTIESAPTNCSAVQTACVGGGIKPRRSEATRVAYPIPTKERGWHDVSD